MSIFKSLKQKNKIIVLGNQKSGTTAIAALLAEYAGLSVMLDIAGIYKVHIGEMKFDEFVKAHRKQFAARLLKEPMFTFMFEDVKNTFPSARFLFIIRDPRDTIRSILNRLDIMGNLENPDVGVLDKINAAWRKVFEKKWLGLEGDTYIDILAARWNYAADVYLKNKDDMLLIRYEDFNTAKLSSVKDIAASLNLAEKNDITGKLDVQYQPKGDSEVAYQDFFGEKNLRKIEDICASRMSGFGYLT